MGEPNQTNVRPQQGTTKPATTCPIQVEKPCDVDTLGITVTAFDDDAKGVGAQTGARKQIPMYLHTTEKLRGKKVVDAKGQEVREDFLGAYDLVIEAIADYNSAETPRNYSDPSDLVTIDKVQAGYTTPDCPQDSHALLKMVAKTGAPEIPSKEIVLHREGVNNLKIEGKKFLAPNMHYDVAAMGTGPFVVFEWILSLWACNQPKEIEIFAMGCGHRAKGDTRAVNHDLRALVRIHRRDKWTIGVKIPPLGSYKDELKPDGSRENTLTYGLPGAARTQVKTEKDYSSGGLQSNPKGTRDLVERQVTLSTGGDGKQTGVERINRFGDAERGKRTNYKTLNDRLSRMNGFDVAIARNDREIGLEDLIGQSKAIAQGAKVAYQNRGLALQQLKKSVQNFAAAISTIQDLFSKVPKLGFYFEFSLSVFAGSIVFEWAPAYQGGPLSGRYYPVGTEFKFKIAMEIINLSLTLGFGIKCYAAGTGFKASIEGILKFKIAIEKEFAGDDDQRKKLEVVGVCDGSLQPILHVSILGWTVTEAKAAVSSGLEFKGYFMIDKKAGQFGLKGVVKSKPVVLTASFYTGWWGGTKVMDPYTLLNGAVIYTFK